MVFVFEWFIFQGVSDAYFYWNRFILSLVPLCCQSSVRSHTYAAGWLMWAFVKWKRDGAVRFHFYTILFCVQTTKTSAFFVLFMLCREVCGLSDSMCLLINVFHIGTFSYPRNDVTICWMVGLYSELNRIAARSPLFSGLTMFRPTRLGYCI